MCPLLSLSTMWSRVTGVIAWVTPSSPPWRRDVGWLVYSPVGGRLSGFYFLTLWTNTVRNVNTPVCVVSWCSVPLGICRWVEFAGPHVNSWFYVWGKAKWSPKAGVLCDICTLKAQRFQFLYILTSTVLSQPPSWGPGDPYLGARQGKTQNAKLKVTKFALLIFDSSSSANSTRILESLF